jgi:hypothetical protein
LWWPPCIIAVVGVVHEIPLFFFPAVSEKEMSDEKIKTCCSCGHQHQAHENSSEVFMS